jgi:uncharacterized Zn finger protein
MLKEKRMIPVQVNIYCDKCGTEMEISDNEHAFYYYRCPECGEYVAAIELYPVIKYIDDDAVTDTKEFDKEPCDE